MLKNAFYAGYLARLHGPKAPATLFGQHEKVSQFDVIRERRWFSFLWSPSIEIKFDRKEQQAVPQANSYPFMLRESRDRFILVSTHHSVVQAFLRECGVESQIEYPRIDVIQLVSQLAHPSDETGRAYRMGNVFASIEGFGRALRTIGLWGDDIADASLFSDLSPRISPYRVTLRDPRSDREIASVGSGGEMTFFYRGVNQLDQTDKLFRFLSEQHFIAWGITRE